MAKYAHGFRGNFDAALERLHSGILGGSQGILFKINTWSEEALLDKVREIAEHL